MWFCSNPFWKRQGQAEFGTCLENTVLLALPTLFVWWRLLQVLLKMIRRRDVSSSTSRHPMDKVSSGSEGMASLQASNNSGPKRCLRWLKTTTCLGAVVAHLTAAYLNYRAGVDSEVAPMLVKALNCLLVTGIMLAHGPVVRTDETQAVFWLLQMSCDMPRYYRHLIRLLRGTSTAGVATATADMTVFPVVLLALVSSGLRDSSRANDVSPFYKLSFGWFSSLILTTFRKSSISVDQLPRISEELSSEHHLLMPPNGSLLSYIWNMHSSHLLEGSLLSVIFVILRITSCLEFNALILYIENQEAQFRGYMYVVSIFTMNVASSVMQRYADYIFISTSLRVKNQLLLILNNQALNIGSGRLSEQNDLIKLTTNDVENVCSFVSSFGTLVAAPLYIVYTTCVLEDFIHWCSVVAVGVLLFFIFLVTLTTRRHRLSQKRRADLLAQKNACACDAINNICAVKMHGWDGVFFNLWMSWRSSEQRYLKISTFWLAVLKVLWSLTPFMVIAIAFGVYATTGNIIVIRASTAFVCVSLLSGLRFALSSIPDFICCMVLAKSSLAKLSEFLSIPSINSITVQRNGVEIANAQAKQSNPCRYNQDYSGNQDNLSRHRPKAGSVSLIAATISVYDTLRPNCFLQNITLSINKGTLNVFIGLPGSGKSTLLAGLAGDAYVTDGLRHVYGRVAYLPQKPWLFRGTVRENILLDKPFDPKHYLDVLKRCVLNDWINLLPEGDDTILADDNVIVNEEYKKLLQLARAVYHDCDIYVMDAPLSRVSAGIASAVVSQVISNDGILKNKSRILVTNNQRLLCEANQAFLLSQGKVVEQTTFEQIVNRCEMDSKFDLSELMAFNESGETAMVLDDERDQEIFRKQERATSTVTMTEPVIVPDDTLTTQDDSSDEKLPKMSWRIIVDFFSSKMMLRTIATLLLLSLASRCCDLLAGFDMIMWSQDKLEWGVSHRNFRLISYTLLGVGHAVLLGLGFFAVSTWLQQHAQELCGRYLARILEANLPILASAKSNPLKSRLTKDAEILEINFPIVLSLLCEVSIQLLLISGLTWTVMPLSAPGSAIIFGVYFTVQLVYVWTMRRIKPLDANARTQVNDAVADLVSGSTTLRSLDMSGFWTVRFSQIVDSAQVTQFTMGTGRLWLLLVLDLLGHLLLLNINIFIIYYRSSLSAGLAGLISSYTLGSLGSFHSVVQYAVETITCIAISKRISNSVVCFRPMLKSNRNQAGSRFPTGVTDLQQLSVQSIHNVPHDWPSRGSISLTDFTARKSGLATYPVLKNITLNIAPGEKVAILGPNGAGKSALLLALFKGVLRMRGSLVVDGVELDCLSLDYSHSRMGYLPSEQLIFQGTIRFNLDPENAHSDIEIWSTLSKIQFNMVLPQGLNTQVSELHLSLGQRQLLCLGRLVLRAPMILAIDEANANLDAESIRLIRSIIVEEFHASTVLHVTHRPESILNHDRVVIMVDGEMQEIGEPHKLLAQPKSAFRRMAREAGITGRLLPTLSVVDEFDL